MKASEKSLDKTVGTEDRINFAVYGDRNDWDAGLIHVGARYYDFETGRWVQAWFSSPLEAEHCFVYVRNNPIVFVDPKGNSVPIMSILIGIGIGIVSGIAIEIIGSIVEHIDEHAEVSPYPDWYDWLIGLCPCDCYRLPSWQEFLPEVCLGSIGGAIHPFGGVICAIAGKIISEILD